MTKHWAPACDIAQLQLRAEMLKKIRLFFASRQVLEVETPLLCHATGTDPQLDFFSSEYHCLPDNKQMYLQTSPEFAMKRLLASGSGSIYQICKAFRNAEMGQIHNPEFSILEWYRVSFNLQQLMAETIELLADLLPPFESTELSYQELFEQVTGLNPLVFGLQDYIAYAEKSGIADAITLCEDDHCLWLDFIFSHIIQPALVDYDVCLVYGYPAIQASLARINCDNPAIADRFEVFIQGIEIGNGFFELADRQEQELRFDQENKIRSKMGLIKVEKDNYFLDALSAGIPECSGIAIGLDRLLMKISNTQSLAEVIAFPFERA